MTGVSPLLIARHTTGDPERSPVDHLRNVVSYFPCRRHLISAVPSRSSVDGSGTGCMGSAEAAFKIRIQASRKPTYLSPHSLPKT